MVVLGVVVVAVLLFFLPLTVWTPLAAIVGVLSGLLTIVDWVRRVLHPADPARPVAVLAKSLAEAVAGQWGSEAGKRLLLPTPIPVGWSLSELPVAGPLEAAIGDLKVAPAFPPLPGLKRVTKKQLRAGGGRGELFSVYGGIDSGRMVVVGEPGAGKTGSAVLLVIDALDHRAHAEDKDQARIPVPVLVTAHGWDPTTCSARDWLAGRLAAAYPLFQHRGGQSEAAKLIDAGAVALILDGLDEMGDAQRSAALRELGRTNFRIVVFTRGQQMAQATGAQWLVGAVALHLRDVTSPEAADYLYRARDKPPPAGWEDLLAHLRQHPGSVLARGLSSPLTITLLRDAYQASEDVHELCNSTRYGTPDAIKQHLIARLLTDAYTPGPDAPRYSLAQARQVLAFLAHKMNHHKTSDLGWWQIPRWASTTPRILTSMIAGGLLGGILCAVLAALANLVPHLQVPPSLLREPALSTWAAKPVNPLVLVFVLGFGVGLPLGFGGGRGGREPKRAKTGRAIKLRSLLIVGLEYALVVGIVVPFLALLVVVIVLFLSTFLPIDPQFARLQQPPTWFYLLAWITGGILIGLPLALRRNRDRLDSPRESVKNRRTKTVVGLMAAIVAVVALGITIARQQGNGGIVGWILIVTMVAIMVVFMLWSVPRLAGGFVTGLAEDQRSPLGPLESWRHDRAFGLVAGLAFGLAAGIGSALSFGLGAGLTFGLVTGLQLGLVVGLVVGLTQGCVTGLTVGLTYGITSSARWSTTLAWRLQLQRSCRGPADLLSFLEDARNRHVLRTNGDVYQFRHTALQDHLAEHYSTAASATSSTARLST